MVCFTKIVKRHASARSKPFNFQSSQGGVYSLSFFGAFVAGNAKFTPNLCTSMIFRPRRDLDMHIYLDFDFKGRSPTTITTADLVVFSKKVAKIVGAEDIVITKRVSSYLKVTEREMPLLRLPPVALRWIQPRTVPGGA